VIMTSYNSNTGLYEGSLTVDDSVESGKWEVYLVMLEDYQGNDIYYYSADYDLTAGNFNVKDSDISYEAIEGVTVVTKNEMWSNKIITGDVYIGPDAVLQISGKVNIYGNLYVLGALKSYGGLNLSGILYGRSTSFGGSPTLYNGTIVISGSNSISSMIMTTYPVTDIPIRIDEIEYSSANKISIKGATLKIADMYIDGELVNLDHKGRFSLDNINTNGKEKITITFITVFGNTITREIDIPKSNDVNGDGVIDILDISLIAKSYNKSKSDSDWNSKFDLNDDGIIDIFDLVSISKKI
ncbi:dockerin type I domain-containing protein, partial [uncultured Clostridium sp.]|uniref:dockerin type I domain-containing protein n=1 Tax=uncultured Clostridium sp. TaxID=59620 RepID=UPI002596AE8E